MVKMEEHAGDSSHAIQVDPLQERCVNAVILSEAKNLGFRFELLAATEERSGRGGKDDCHRFPLSLRRKQLHYERIYNGVKHC